MENKYADVYKAEWSDVAIVEGTWALAGPHFAHPYFPDDLAELAECFKDAQYWGPRQMTRWRLDGRDFDCFYTFPEARMRYIRVRTAPLAQALADCESGRWKKGDFIEVLQGIDEETFRGYVRGAEHVVPRDCVKGASVGEKLECLNNNNASCNNNTLREKQKGGPFSRIAEFYKRSEMCDVAFVASSSSSSSSSSSACCSSSSSPAAAFDTPTILCHRLVLGTRSEVLKEVLEDGPVGGAYSNVVTLECDALGISLKALKLIIDYFYFDKIELDFSSALETVKFVEKFAVEDETLEMVGKIGVVRNLNARNVAQTWRNHRHSPVLNEICKRWMIKYTCAELTRNPRFLCGFDEDDLACVLRDERIGKWCRVATLLDAILERASTGDDDDDNTTANLLSLLRLHELDSAELAARRTKIPPHLYVVALERKLGIPPMTSSQSRLLLLLLLNHRPACLKCSAKLPLSVGEEEKSETLKCRACDHPIPSHLLDWPHFALSNSCEFVGYE